MRTLVANFALRWIVFDTISYVVEITHSFLHWNCPNRTSWSNQRTISCFFCSSRAFFYFYDFWMDFWVISDSRVLLLRFIKFFSEVAIYRLVKEHLWCEIPVLFFPTYFLLSQGSVGSGRRARGTHPGGARPAARGSRRAAPDGGEWRSAARAGAHRAREASGGARRARSKVCTSAFFLFLYF